MSKNVTFHAIIIWLITQFLQQPSVRVRSEAMVNDVKINVYWC